MHTTGAVLAYGPLWMMWQPTSLEQVKPEQLALLHLVKPVPDLFVFGSGRNRQLPPRETQRALEELQIGLEVLPTVRHCQRTCAPQWSPHIRSEQVHLKMPRGRRDVMRLAPSCCLL